MPIGGGDQQLSDSEYELAKQMAEARRHAHGQRLLQAVHAEIKSYAEEVAYLAREKQDETTDSFQSLWDAFCYQVARGKPEDLANYEEPIRALCREVLDGTGNFIPKLFAICTTEYDEFERRDFRPEQPPYWFIDEWATKAIYVHVLEEAQADAKSGFLSYNQKGMERLLACLRSLKRLANNERELVGLRQAIEGVETLRGGRRTERNLDVECGFRAGDSYFEEGLFVFINIREDSIELETMNTSYNKDVGSDHESKQFSLGQIDNWCEIFEQVISRDDAKLSVSFNTE